MMYSNVRFGKKELDQDKKTNIMIDLKLRNNKAYRELFKLRQELQDYNFNSQFFILRYLSEAYIEKEMVDAATEIIDYMYLITGLQLWVMDYDYEILSNLKNKIKKMGE